MLVESGLPAAAALRAATLTNATVLGEKERLGSIAAGDIGRHFPDSDPRFKGADSRELLRACMALVLREGYRLGNADITIIAERPRVAPHAEAMRTNIAADLGARVHQVNVKATTTEGLGFTGRREGTAAHAVVLLEPLTPAGRTVNPRWPVSEASPLTKASGSSGALKASSFAWSA